MLSRRTVLLTLVIGTVSGVIALDNLPTRVFVKPTLARDGGLLFLPTVQHP
jgi:hypothetical protein